MSGLSAIRQSFIIFFVFLQQYMGSKEQIWALQFYASMFFQGLDTQKHIQDFHKHLRWSALQQQPSAYVAKLSILAAYGNRGYAFDILQIPKNAWLKLNYYDLPSNAHILYFIRYRRYLVLCTMYQVN